MKNRNFFQKTLTYIELHENTSDEHELTLVTDDICEKVVTVREEARTCTAYLEELFKFPRIDRNMVKIIRAIQEPAQRILAAYDFGLRTHKFRNDGEPACTLRAQIEYCQLSSEAVCGVLELMADLFFQFMDKDDVMPRIYYYKCAAGYLDSWNKMMADHCFPDAVLEELNWLKTPFGFDEAGQPTELMSYHELDCLQAITFEGFHTLYSCRPEDDALTQLRAHLWNHNFNLEEYGASLFYAEIDHLRELPLQEQIPAVVKVINRVRQRKRAAHPVFVDEPWLKDYIMRRLTDYLDGLKLRLSTGRFLGEALPPEGRPQQLKINLPPEKLGHLLRYLQEHQVVAGMEPGVLLNFACTFFQPAKGGRYLYEILSAAYHANPVISEHNVKRLLDPHQ